MTEPTVLTRRDGDVFTLTFNRPDRLNAMSVESFAAVNAALDEAEQAGARVLVVTGAGRAFNSGADLQAGSGLQIGSTDMGEALETTFNPLIERLLALPFPVISAVNGPAAGAGVGIALAADFVLMARSAYLLLAFVNIGLVPDAGVTWFLPRLVGRQRALELMMLGERLPAEKAEAWGLAYRCVEDAALETETTALALRLAAGPTKAYAGMKRALNRSIDADLTRTLDVERETQREAGFTEDFAEGVYAFVSKRPAAFKGR